MNTYFEKELIYNGIKFQLTDKPTMNDREIHTYHEILYFIEGDVELFNENSRIKLKRNSLIMVPRGVYHFISLHSRTFLRLKISIPQGAVEENLLKSVVAKFGLWDNFGEETDFVLKKLVRTLQEEDAKPFYAYGALLMLIAETDRQKKRLPDCPDKTDVVYQITQYISRHPGSDLTIKSLANAVNASPSAITHGFKRQLGISIHSYIKQKRLIHARELILSGNKPSKIYSECGYREYSSFYRAYVDFFGYPPSKEK